ncbi:hypothetical protein [Cryptosporangium sp. NPDC051539]|uniref:DUF7700 domain-containing protein n=1 Tax=Cryptosporangium sp. NPDC051539 TaxID=3363962 RepID=UPI0037AEC88A
MSDAFPQGQVEDLVMPIAENTRYVEAGRLTFGVEFRELNARIIEENYGHDPEMMKFFATKMDVDDVGITLHVYSTEDMRERLRFDAFGDRPHLHYHYIRPDGSHEKVDYDWDACGDLIPWALRTLEQRLPDMLRRAGATALAEDADVASVRAAAPTITETARALFEERRHP